MKLFWDDVAQWNQQQIKDVFCLRYCSLCIIFTNVQYDIPQKLTSTEICLDIQIIGNLLYIFMLSFDKAPKSILSQGISL